MKPLLASLCAVLALGQLPVQVLAQGRFGSFRPSGPTFNPGQVIQQFTGGGNQVFSPGTTNVFRPTTPQTFRIYPGGGSQANNPYVTPTTPNKQYHLVGGSSQSNNPFPGSTTPYYYKGGGNQLNNPFPGMTSYYDTLYPQPVPDHTPAMVPGFASQKDNPHLGTKVSPYTGGGNQVSTPLSRLQTGSGSNQPTITYLTERYLGVRNIGNETVRLHLRWYGDNGKGQKQWLPPGGEVATYTIRPNTEGYLTWNKVPISAEKVRFWGSTSSGKTYTAYRQRDLFLVEEVQGRRQYQAANLQTHTLTFRN